MAAVKKTLPGASTAAATDTATPIATRAISTAVKSTTKSVAKTASKPTAKPASARTIAKPATQIVVATAPDSAASKAAKKPKLVRDSFTIPKLEYLVLDELKARAAKLASPAKKSEVLRAGVKALAAMNDAGFLSALKAVPAVKTGRPNRLVPD